MSITFSPNPLTTINLFSFKGLSLYNRAKYPFVVIVLALLQRLIAFKIKFF